MRYVPFLLLLAAAAAADESFATDVKVFERARVRIAKPGAQAEVVGAIERLLESGRAEAVRHLADFIVQTFQEEADTFQAIRTAQAKGASAYERHTVLEREIRDFKLKERAGDRTAGPEIEKRRREHKKRMREFTEITQEVERLTRFIDFVRDVREKLVKGTAQVLSKQEGAEESGAFGALRQTFDIADAEQVLFLIRILGASGKVSAEPHLIEILQHPKTVPAARQEAMYAMVPTLTRKGGRTLIGIARENPDNTGRHAMHALGLAAKRHLNGVDEASKFVEGLE